jgi:hypothetical protein
LRLVLGRGRGFGGLLLRLGVGVNGQCGSGREEDRDDGRSEKAHVYPKRKVSHAVESRSKDFNRGFSKARHAGGAFAIALNRSGLRAGDGWAASKRTRVGCPCVAKRCAAIAF